MKMLAAALVAVLLALAAPAHAAQRSLTPDVRVLTSNLGSGAECSAGCLATVDAQIALWSPDAVALQEVCASDVAAFEAEHASWTVAFRPVISGYAGCAGDKGDMVAAPTVERTTTIDLPGDTDAPGAGNNGPTLRDYGAVCADIGDEWVCSAHLIPPGLVTGTVRVDQVNALLDATRGWSKVALAGDFNMRPVNGALDALRDAGYVETDRADSEPTEGGPPRTVKYDYIWWHRGSDVPPAAVSGLVVSQPTSHHDLLRGSVTW